MHYVGSVYRNQVHKHIGNYHILVKLPWMKNVIIGSLCGMVAIQSSHHMATTKC